MAANDKNDQHDARKAELRRILQRHRGDLDGAGVTQVELARRATISPSYYAKLEEGTTSNPSVEVLQAIARELRLDEASRHYLFDWFGKPMPVAPPRKRETVSQAFQAVLDYQGEHPACIMGRAWYLLAWNEAMCAVFGDLGRVPEEDQNIAWLMFTDAALRENIVNWEYHARRVAGEVRSDYAKHAKDPRFTAIVDSLLERSREFARFWRQQDPGSKSEVRKELNHPDVGRLVLQQTTMRLHDDPELRFVLYTPVGEECRHCRKAPAGFQGLEATNR